MKEEGIAILVVLALIGVGMAFAFVGLAVSGESRSEDVWMYQRPVKGELTSFPTLTEEQRQAAIEIAKQNETVKQYLDQGYEMEGVSATFSTPTTEGGVVTLKGGKKELICAVIDLNEGKVTEIDRLSGEGMMVSITRDESGTESIKILPVRETCKIIYENETEIGIAIGDKVGTLIIVGGIELTEEEKKEAREIAISDPKVKDLIEGKNYEMKISGITELRMNEIGEAEAELGGASVTFELEKGTIYFVHVDIEKGKVIRISPPLLPPPMPPINK